MDTCKFWSAWGSFEALLWICCGVLGHPYLWDKRNRTDWSRRHRRCPLKQWRWRLSCHSNQSILFYLCLSGFLGGEGRAFPSYSTIGQWAEYTMDRSLVCHRANKETNNHLYLCAFFLSTLRIGNNQLTNLFRSAYPERTHTNMGTISRKVTARCSSLTQNFLAVRQVLTTAQYCLAVYSEGIVQ